MKRKLVVLVCASVALTPACGSLPGRSAAPTAGVAGSAVVDRVVDGDTVVLRIRGTREHARLIGVDTPETVKPNAPVQCFGPEASRHLEALLPPGTRVRAVRDTESRDRFGRLLVYLWRLPDERFVNLDLIAGGFARTLFIAPNVAYRDQFSRAATTASAQRKGLWGSCQLGVDGAGHR